MLIQSILDKVQNQLAALPVRVAVVLPGERRVGDADAPLTIRFKDWKTAASMTSGNIGAIGEAYVEGRVSFDGSVRDLMAAGKAMLPHAPVLDNPGIWTRLLRHAQSVAHHSLSRDAQQIQFHYDVSDDFYALWLDPRRVYSCAYFARPDMTLTQAQEAKIDHVCKKLQLRAGERYLDIGAGWGGLLLWAAENYGVDATGITLSKNQHARVNALIEQKGLQGRVRMLLLDYRNLPPDQPFDKISSIGMFEHVGRANMTMYFQKIRSLLKPGGLVMNHGITSGGVANDQLGSGMGDFIEKYIFPGGELMHASRVLHHMAEGGLEMVDTENLRPHYARTLWDWSDSLEAQLPRAREILHATAGPERGEQVLRAYRLYLAGSAMSFEEGWIALHQMLAAHPDGSLGTGSMRGAQSSYPFNREYIYR